VLYVRFLYLALHLKEKRRDSDSLLLATLCASFHSVNTSAIRTWGEFVPFLGPDELEPKITEGLLVSEVSKSGADGCSSGE